MHERDILPTIEIDSVTHTLYTSQNASKDALTLLLTLTLINMSDDSDTRTEDSPNAGPPTIRSSYNTFLERLRRPSSAPLVASLQDFVKNFPKGVSKEKASKLLHFYLTKMETRCKKVIQPAFMSHMINHISNIRKIWTMHTYIHLTLDTYHKRVAEMYALWK